MSDTHMEAVLEELKKVNRRLDSQEQLVSQLIGIVKSTNEKATHLQEDITVLKRTSPNYGVSNNSSTYAIVRSMLM